MELGSLADWFGALGTISAVIIALQKPREPLVFSITDDEKLLIENISSLRTKLILTSKKDSAAFNGIHILEAYGEYKSKLRIAFPLENSGKRIYKIRIFDENTGKSIKLRIVDISRLTNDFRISEVKIYRKENFKYSQEFHTLLKVKLVKLNKE